MGYIRIPEKHYLFNFGTLDEAQYLENPPFSQDQFKRLYTYAFKHLAKAGIPMTIEESLPYGWTGDNE